MSNGYGRNEMSLEDALNTIMILKMENKEKDRKVEKYREECIKLREENSKLKA